MIPTRLAVDLVETQVWRAEIRTLPSLSSLIEFMEPVEGQVLRHRDRQAVSSSGRLPSRCHSQNPRPVLMSISARCNRAGSATRPAEPAQVNDGRLVGGDEGGPREVRLNSCGRPGSRCPPKRAEDLVVAVGHLELAGDALAEGVATPPGDPVAVVDLGPESR